MENSLYKTLTNLGVDLVKRTKIRSELVIVRSVKLPPGDKMDVVLDILVGIGLFELLNCILVVRGCRNVM